MPKTVVDGKELIYSGFAVAGENSVIEITIDYDNDLAIWRFVLDQGDTPTAKARQISQNEIEMRITFPKGGLANAGGLVMQPAGELAGRSLWMSTVFQAGIGPSKITTVIVHYAFFVGDKANG